MATYVMSDIKNAKQFPQVYYARHMVQGIAGYENEKILVDATAMKKAAPSFVGKPVYVQHQDVNLDTIQSDADGYVTDCFYNTLDGWLWAKMLVVSDDGNQAIKEGWSVSNAYVPVEWDNKGQHLNVDYDRKITNYNFTHLAIVPNPRYEEAKIFTPEEFKTYQDLKQKELTNSKPIKETGIMSFFKKAKVELKAGEAITLDALTEITNAAGEVEEVSLAQLIENYKIENAKKNTKLNDDDMMDVDGEMVSIGNMKECWAKKNGKAKKNEAKMDNPEEESDEEEGEEKPEPKENKKHKKNAEGTEKEDGEKDEEEEKKNALKRVQEISNAHLKPSSAPVETSVNQLARGKARYGSK